jgi:hypothetical protein
MQSDAEVARRFHGIGVGLDWLPVGPALRQQPSALVQAALAHTATAMAALSVALRSMLVERHLEGAFVLALNESATALGIDAAASTQHRVKFAEWPGVGSVDVALSIQGPNATTMELFELKWGAGTLYNCVWDLPKMALAVALSQCARAYLIAGAPEDDPLVVEFGGGLLIDHTVTR